LQSCLDIFDTVGLKGVYAPKRTPGEREHQLHDQNAPYSRRVLSVSAPGLLRNSIRAGTIGQSPQYRVTRDQTNAPQKFDFDKSDRFHAVTGG
jgi:hypothetical protein